MFDAALTGSSADTDGIHREAYNAAFYELGLCWHWDADIYRRLRPDASGAGDRIREYLETYHPHMLKVYDAAFLVDAIQDAKARCIAQMSGLGRNAARGINWAEVQRSQVGI